MSVLTSWTCDGCGNTAEVTGIPRFPADWVMITGWDAFRLGYGSFCPECWAKMLQSLKGEKQ